MVKHPTASTRTFKASLEALDPALVEWMQHMKFRNWDSARLYIESRAEQYLRGRLSPAERSHYETLLTLAPQHGISQYDPHSFVHDAIPVETQAELMQRYKTREQLRNSSWNPHTPRGDVYAAWKLGLLSDDEFERIPVMFRKRDPGLRRKRR